MLGILDSPKLWENTNMSSKTFFQLKIYSHFRSITQSMVMVSAFLCSC